MKRGVKLIYQGVLLQPTEVGIPDLLEKMPGRSKFGKYFYRPVRLNEFGIDSEPCGPIVLIPILQPHRP
jgi:hypothetical protein